MVALKFTSWRKPNINSIAQFAIWSIVSLITIYAFYEIIPIFDQGEIEDRIFADPDYKENTKLSMNEIANTGEKKGPFVFKKYINQLIEVEVSYHTYGGNDGPEVLGEVARATLKTDRLVLYFGFIAILVLAAILTHREGIKIRLPISPSEALAGENYKPNEVSSLDLITIKTILKSEAEKASARADRIFARSTFLLIAGIILTFIGVAIFYITLPEASTNESLQSFVPKAIRPTGVLFFIEAIAWFLLRQYRALTEDYKWFYRHYTTRTNYLSALLIFNESPTTPELKYLAATLLNEDITGRLRIGETTESLEALKINDRNPIIEIMNIFGRVREHNQ